GGGRASSYGGAGGDGRRRRGAEQMRRGARDLPRRVATPATVAGAGLQDGRPQGRRASPGRHGQGRGRPTSGTRRPWRGARRPERRRGPGAVLRRGVSAAVTGCRSTGSPAVSPRALPQRPARSLTTLEVT